jgi:hypothetical protein
MHWYALSTQTRQSQTDTHDTASKRMFKWLAKQFTAADEDPDSLGSEVGLQNFIDALPVTLPARTLEAIGEQFEHARALELAPERLRRALKALDERAQAPLEAVVLGLIPDERGRELSDSAWLTLSRFHRNLYAGYRVCLDALSTDEQRANAHADAVLIACRSMAALSRYKTLLRMRYRDVEPGYWDNTLGLAAWAAHIGAMSTLVELYPRCGYQSSVERELLIALLFEAAPLANLLPPQMAALELILRRFAALYQFSDSYRESVPFVVEPGAGPVVKRWLKGLKPRPGLRFFGIGPAYAKLAGLQKECRDGGKLPDWVTPAHVELDAYRALLDLLLSHWSVEPPRRRQRRDQAEGELLVTRGVAQVRRMIAASEYAQAGGRLSYENNTPYDHKLFGRVRFGSVDASLEQLAAEQADTSATPMETLQKFELEGDRQMTERWTLADVSESGLGATATAHGGWARVGMLIGYRRMDSLDWQMAVVRRLSRSPQGRLCVGMQTIAGDAYCARIRIGAGDAGNTWVAVAGTADAYHDAILLLDPDTAPSVLLQQGIFGGELDCMISFEKRWRAARLLRVADSGYDYERIEISLAETPRAH